MPARFHEFLKYFAGVIHLSCMFVRGMIRPGVTGTDGDAITPLEVVNLYYEITIIMEKRG